MSLGQPSPPLIFASKSEFSHVCEEGETKQVTVVISSQSGVNAPPTQGALQHSTAQKMENSPLFALCCAAAPGVNTLLGNDCFHFLRCVTQT